VAYVKTGSMIRLRLWSYGPSARLTHSNRAPKGRTRSGDRPVRFAPPPTGSLGGILPGSKSIAARRNLVIRHSARK
jgi:hypothetical protein